jgi:two-component system CheB/CheR fusion protein
MTVPEDPQSVAEFEALLLYLKQSRGFDFTAYKRASLMRRVLVRMQTVNIQGFSNYHDYLQVDPEEFTQLFNTILINVTAFFRDPLAWQQVAEQVLPLVVGPRGSTHPIRAWSAGCASGAEAYTIAMLLAEALGMDRFRQRVKIYATDVDEEALSQARQASYDERALQEVPVEFVRRYFERQEQRYIFNKDLRRSVIFGRHDLIQDAPISRVNLLTCRNCLMYFNAEAQTRILNRFQFALAEGGVLFLGKAETLLTHLGSFATVNAKRRIFSKTGQGNAPERPPAQDALATGSTDPRQERLRAAANDAAPIAQIVVDAPGFVVAVNQQARTLFNLRARDLGRPLQDLEVSYRPVELRSSIARAYSERQPITFSNVSWRMPTEQQVFLELLVVPIPKGNGSFLGASIFFLDVTRQRRLQDDLQRTNQELETTNEELQTINDEARDRGDELTELNGYLESILTSLRSGVVVLDRELHVRKWNQRSEDMWGRRSDEVSNENFLNLDIGLPIDQLKVPLRACLALDTDSHRAHARGHQPPRTGRACQSHLHPASHFQPQGAPWGHAVDGRVGWWTGGSPRRG